MHQTTKGIVLRSVKYGETSLILTVFTEIFGKQSYILKGVRSEKTKSKRAGLLQVASILDFVVEHRPNRHLQHIKEFQPSYLYQSLQEDIVKNSIAIYSVELLTRLLPEEEVMEELFHFVYQYFLDLDKTNRNTIANYPLFFTIQCGKHFGYNVLGNFSDQTPYLNAIEGVFSAQPPSVANALEANDISAIAALIKLSELDELNEVAGLNALARNRILDWYIQFLQHHTQHLSNLRSLEVLRTILH